MSRGTLAAWRSFAAALALLGVLLHATLVPWHAGARAAAQSAVAGLNADLGIICHGGGSASTDAVPVSTRGEQEDRSQDCPVCKGLAAAALALVAGPVALPLPSSIRLAQTRPVTTILAGSNGLEPRSRGPPIHV